MCRGLRLGRFLLVMVVGAGVMVQAASKELSGKRAWETHWRIKGAIERNDNVFKLSESQKYTMALNDSGTNISGRFNDMKTVDDIILSTSLEFEALTKQGMFGRQFSVTAEIGYQQYARNSRQSHIDYGLAVEQKTSDQGKVRLQSKYLPSLFRKNYLADAIDLTGKVAVSERVYKPGVYSEWDVALDYKHHFPKWVVDVTGDLIVGYRARSYDDPFKGRNQNALSGGLTMDLDFTKWWSADVGYMYESVHSPVSSEVLVLDEPDYWLDFNNDRDTADKNVRTVQQVDRSHAARTVEVSTRFKVIPRLTLHAGLEYLVRDYASNERIDPGYRDRHDSRNTIKLGLDFHIMLGFYLVADYERVNQKTNRQGDPESFGETTDYELRIVRGGVIWRF